MTFSFGNQGFLEVEEKVSSLSCAKSRHGLTFIFLVGCLTLVPWVISRSTSDWSVLFLGVRIHLLTDPLALLILLLAVASAMRLRKGPPPERLILLWILVGLAGLIAASISPGAEGIGWFSLILGAFLLALLFHSPSQAELRTVALCLSTLLATLVLLGLILNFSGLGGVSQLPSRLPWELLGISQVSRWWGLFQGPGYLGFASAFIVIATSLRLNRYTLVLMAVGFAGLVASDSRSAFLAVFTASLVTLVRRTMGTPPQRYRQLSGLLLAVVFSGLYFTSLALGDPLSGLEARQEIWSVATEQLNSASPSTEDVRPSWAYDTHAHNLVLSILLRAPIVTSLLIVWLVLTLVCLFVAIARGNSFAISFITMSLVYSQFEYGVDPLRLNFAYFTLAIGIFGLSECRKMGDGEVAARSRAAFDA